MNMHTKPSQEFVMTRPDDGIKVGDPLLVVDHISLSFGGVKAISDISFDVRKGEIRAIIGPNGIGKSTALRVLSGNLKPNLGKFDSPPDWKEVLKHFRGSEIQNFF